MICIITTDIFNQYYNGPLDVVLSSHEIFKISNFNKLYSISMLSEIMIKLKIIFKWIMYAYLNLYIFVFFLQILKRL